MFEPIANAQVTSRYRLIREIGRGGMGSVWEAHDSELDAACALKFILNQEAKPPDVRHRFLREARAVARLHSPHAVGIRGVGEWEGALYIAMELLVGETLFARLSRSGALSPAETVRIVEQLSSVLTMAHREGFVHRDLKPENVWLCGDAVNPQGTTPNQLIVKLLDFGVAKQVLEGVPLLKTATGLLVGTPYYMSPEQAGNRQVDYHSDLWSLALIAVECLTGSRVFRDASALYELLDKIVRGPAPVIQELYPAATPALVEWWSRATSKVPQERHNSATELAVEFSRGVFASQPLVVETKKNLPHSPLPSSGVSPTPEGRPGPMTLTTPGDHQANPWSDGRRAVVAESVGPLSNTQGPGRGGNASALPKLGLLVALLAGVGASAWWVTTRSGETASDQAPPVAAASSVPLEEVGLGVTSSPVVLEATSTRQTSEGTAAPPGSVSHVTSFASPATSVPPAPSVVAKAVAVIGPKPSPIPIAPVRPTSKPAGIAATPKPQASPKPSRSGL